MKNLVLERENIKELLIEKAKSDKSIISAVIFGSASKNEEDEWSDIDLGFRVSENTDIIEVCDSWTTFMKEKYTVSSTLDIYALGAIYRVFLLDSTLQIDLSFWPYDKFTIIGSSYIILFGEAIFIDTPPTDINRIIGMGWLYLLHARSSIARCRYWQAQQMLEELRNQIFMLKCNRLGVSYNKGKGIDYLPKNETEIISDYMPKNLSIDDLCKAFINLSELYLHETKINCENNFSKLNIPISLMQNEIKMLLQNK